MSQNHFTSHKTSASLPRLEHAAPLYFTHHPDVLVYLLMTRSVFSIPKQAKQALRKLTQTWHAFSSGKSLDKSIEHYGADRGPTSSRPALCSLLKSTVPSMAKCSSGFYLKLKPKSNAVFDSREQNVLVQFILAVCCRH